MTPTTPNIDKFLLPDGVQPRTYLAPRGQEDHVMPLKTLVTPDGRVVSQWAPDANELELLKNGAPVTLVLHSGGAVPPIQLGVGGFDMRD